MSLCWPHYVCDLYVVMAIMRYILIMLISAIAIKFLIKVGYFGLV